MKSNMIERIARRLAPALRSDAEIKSMVAEEVARAKMALPLNANVDDRRDGFRRMSGNDRLRDLTPLSQQRMFEIAYFMWDSSMMTRRLVKMDRTFIFAEPMTATSEDEAVQEVIDNFWDDPANMMSIAFPDLTMWLGMLGEQCWPVTVNEFNGHVTLGYEDPATIKEVWVNKQNKKQAVRVDLQGQGKRSGKKLAVIRRDTDIRSKTFGLLVGDCFFYAINHPPNSPRGRSDYLTLFDWIDGLERHGYNFMERAELLLNFIWDVELKGFTEDQIREWMVNNPTPEPGSMRAHNENVKWEAVSPKLNATEFKSGFETLKSFIMGGAGRPDSWFGSGGKAFQTEAEVLGQVPIKDLDDRQNLIKFILEQVIQFVIDQAVIAKRLTTAQADVGFSIHAPEISKKDFTKLVNSVPQLATALTVAEQNGWISRKTAIELFAMVAGQMGMDIDPKEELEKAEAAADARVTEDFEESDVTLSVDDEPLVDVSLNGAQIASLLKLVQSVAAKTLPRESALAVITTAFPIGKEAAEKILGTSGKGFSITPAEIE